MGPVLMLCIAAFAVAAGFHALVIVGALQVLSNPMAVALFAVVLVGFVAAILTHPKSESQGGHARLSLVHCFKALKPPARIAYGALLAYGFVAAVASAPMKQGRNKVPLAELVQAPYFFTAFLLIFATCALLASHSAVVYYKHPFGLDEP